eukprot:m.1233928 g.1233928  ORF g.1233928 m.1233928 type:complete len:264 (+) comp24663_c0_seq25:971-1762(+)
MVDPRCVHNFRSVAVHMDGLCVKRLSRGAELLVLYNMSHLSECDRCAGIYFASQLLTGVHQAATDAYAVICIVRGQTDGTFPCGTRRRRTRVAVDRPELSSGRARHMHERQTGRYRSRCACTVTGSTTDTHVRYFCVRIYCPARVCCLASLGASGSGCATRALVCRLAHAASLLPPRMMCGYRTVETRTHPAMLGGLHAGAQQLTALHPRCWGAAQALRRARPRCCHAAQSIPPLPPLVRLCRACPREAVCGRSVLRWTTRLR